MGLSDALRISIQVEVNLKSPNIITKIALPIFIKNPVCVFSCVFVSVLVSSIRGSHLFFLHT